MFTDPKPVVPLFAPDRFVYLTYFAQAYSTTVNNFSFLKGSLSPAKWPFWSDKVAKAWSDSIKDTLSVSSLNSLRCSVGAGFAAETEEALEPSTIAQMYSSYSPSYLLPISSKGDFPSELAEDDWERTSRLHDLVKIRNKGSRKIQKGK